MDHNGSYVLTVTSNLFPNQVLTLIFDVIVQDVAGSPGNLAQLNQISDALSITSIVLFLFFLVILFIVFALYFWRRIQKKKLETSTFATGPLGVK